MRKILFFISLTISILATSSWNLSAQDTAPTYQSLISMGDKEFNKEEYLKAKSYYQEALRIKKDDATAKSKLNKTLQKIREQSEKEEIFYKHVDEADNHFDSEDYEKALASYKKAKQLFPKDDYVCNKIEAITKIINDEKEKIASFNNIINIADTFMSQEKYTEALLQYKSALELYPNHITTKNKYEDAKLKKENYDIQNTNFEQLKREGKEFTLRKKYAEAIEKYKEAHAIFPNNSEVKEIISSLTNTKNISDRYNSKINEADSLYLEKSYEKARLAYNEALAVIQDDSYALDMINRIDETLNSSEYLALKNYLAIIEEAKSLESNNELDAALNKYKSALKTNPGDEFSTQKIDYLTNIINDRNKEIELNAQYNTLVQSGDNCINNEDFYTALDYYKQAHNLIPDKPEIKEKIDITQKRINEIEAQLALEKQKWDEYYHVAIASAEVHMNENNYAEAIKEYNKALLYKENDIVAKQGLSKATQLNETRLANIMTEYNQYISNGDIQFESKNYDKAIQQYSKAEELNTGNTYPAEMINKISTILQENKIAQLVDTNVSIMSNETKRFTFNIIDISVRKSNYILIKARNLSEKSFSMFISYGGENGKNGSIVLRTHKNQDVNDYIIKIGTQYNWFREDNTWIEITPENGDIEIELMEITKDN